MPPYPSPVNLWRTHAYGAISPLLPHLSTRAKNVVITGGGSGIGSAMAYAFANSGAASISILGRREEKLLQTKTKMGKDFPDTKVFTYATDLVDRTSVAKAFDAMKTSIRTVDVLIANAGYSPKLASLEDSRHEDWYDAFDINVKGNVNLIKAFLPIASKTASVLNITAGAAHIPYLPGFSAYSTSKLAAAKIFDYLHHEHPDFFVLNIHPGLIKTGIPGNPNAVNFDDSESSSGPRMVDRADVDRSRVAGKFCSGKQLFSVRCPAPLATMQI